MIFNPNSKEIIYKNTSMKSYFNNAIKITPKRKSDDNTAKSKLLIKTNFNAETSVDSSNFKKPNKNELHMSTLNIPKPKKKICIKYEDLIIDSEKTNNSSNDSNIELALKIKKKRRFANNKINNCIQIFLYNKKEDKKDNNIQQKPKMSKSVSKVLLGAKIDEENVFIEKIRRKFFCCC